MDIRIGRISLRVQRGDISRTDVDAVVNAANNHLWMGSGVAGALKRAGGSEIETEAVSKGPIEIGEAVVTGAGRLPAKYVIHAAAMGQDLATDRAKISTATRNSLARAGELGLESIAFPALGTGVGGFPPESAADAMIAECVECAKRGTIPSLRLIVFVLFSEDVFDAFAKRLQAIH